MAAQSKPKYMVRLRHTALVATLLALSATGKAQTDGSFVGEDNLNYTIIDSEKKYVSVRKGDMSLTGELTIPATVTYNGVTYTITAIDAYGFAGCREITRVTIEGDGVDSVGMEINSSAFSDCDILETVTTGKVSYIDFDAFARNPKLSEIDLRKVVTYIGSTAFTQCPSLKTVETSTTLTKIDGMAFSECYGLESVTINGDDATIGHSAFANDTSLTEIRLPQNLVTLEQSTFAECKSLKSFTAPAALNDIGESAFSGCSSLTTIKLNNGLDSIASAAFSECPALGNFDFPTTITRIGWNAFGGNKTITEFNIPQSVRLIKDGAFMNCTALKRVVFEGGKELSIPYNAFSGDGALEEVIIGEGIVSVGESAFASCTALKTITLPTSLKSIGDYAFAEDTNLQEIKIYATTPPALSGQNCFDSVPGTALLLTPDPEAYTDYQGIFPGEFVKLYAFESIPSDIPTIDVVGGETLFDVFRALADDNDANLYWNANVLLDNDIKMNEVDLDYGILSASNVFGKIDLLPTVGSYSGHMNGAEVSNITARSGGLFGTLEKDAVIENLTFTNATIYVDPTDETHPTSGSGVVIPLLAHTNNGKVLSFGISGDIIVDSELAKDKDISVCLVDEDTEDAELNGYLHIGDLRSTGDNKRCITIKQNLGVNRPTSKKVKVATSSTSSTKSLPTDFEYSEEELMKPVRQFTDEEFANGAVAYWLNFSGAGYTGDYTAKWAQGKTVPVAAKITDGVSNALYKVDYGTTNIKHLTSAPKFANNGSEITIEYSKKPTQVTIGGTAISNFGEKNVTLTFDRSKAIELTFNEEGEPNLAAVASAPEITINGLNVTIEAGSELKQLFSMTGECVGATYGNTLSAPSQGIYILKIGKRVIKLPLR